MKKLISLLLVAIMVAALPTVAFVADITTAGQTGTTPVVLTVEAATFSVTVPTALTVDVAADGEVTCATNARIINNSAGAVKVENVVIEAQNGWALVDFATPLTDFMVNEKKIGLQLNSEAEVTKKAAEGDDVAFAFDAAKWAVMDATDGADGGADELPFTYDAILAPQSSEIADATVANVVFTIGWND